MKVRTFWLILLKIIGLFLVLNGVNVIIYSFNTVHFSIVSGDSIEPIIWISPFIILTVVVYLFILWLFLFKTSWLVDKLHLEKNFEEDIIEINVSLSNILSISIIVIGGIIFIESLPQLCNQIFSFFQQKSLFMESPTAGWIILYFSKATLGYLLMTNSKQITTFIMEVSSHFKSGASLKNRMNRGSFLRKAYIGILVVSAIFSGCRNDESGSNNNKGSFTQMNIKDAKTLFIASSNLSSKMYGIKKSSLRSTSEGEEIYEINYLDENGNRIEEKIPNYIYDAGDFLIVFFKKSQGWVVEEEVYFVRKTDGVVYEAPNEYFPTPCGSNGLIFNSNLNKRRFRFSDSINDLDFLNISYDRDNNFYYTAIRCSSNGECPNTLYRASAISSAAINFKQVSAENETVDDFCVDDTGNIIYIRAGGEWMRYISANGIIGELIPIITKTNWDAPVSAYKFIWNGTDGIMALLTVWGEYSSDGWYTSYPKSRNYLMKLENGQFVKIKEISLEFNNNYPSSYNVFYVHGKVIYSHYYGSTSTLVDISNENSYREIPCSVEANIVINDALYSFNKNTFSLTHINIDNGTTTPIFTLDKSGLSDYFITCIMDVTESSVIFGAYRLSDKVNVIAKIGLDNVLTILQSNSGEVSVVTSLNP